MEKGAKLRRPHHIANITTALAYLEKKNVRLSSLSTVHEFLWLSPPGFLPQLSGEEKCKRLSSRSVVHEFLWLSPPGFLPEPRSTAVRSLGKKNVRLSSLSVFHEFLWLYSSSSLQAVIQSAGSHVQMQMMCSFSIVPSPRFPMLTFPLSRWWHSMLAKSCGVKSMINV